MGGSEQKLEGPDLKAGVDAAAIAPGGKLLGHADGEPVLLARIDDDYVAIGASCTHYSGPLAEGVIVGEEIRCPWHHACFSLRTGEALRSPALNPVACWKVERRGGRVVVTGKSERDPLSKTYPVQWNRENAPRDVCIVGAGAAGTAAAEMLRRCGFDGRITMIDAEPDSPYDRPNLSKDYLAGNAPEDWIPLRPPGFYADHDITIVRGRATGLDLQARRVHVDGQDDVRFDALLLATGADPVRLNIPGGDAPHVHYLRSLADSRSIIQASKGAKKALVMGASFIGLETAASLRTRGLEVHVVAPEARPMERILGPQMGDFIRTLHEQHGVVFHLQTVATAIDGREAVLKDGSRIAADLVVAGIGVRPRTALAEQAGLAVDRGVTVDAQLETSAPGVFAAGDIARWPDRVTGESIRVEHWAVAERQGQTAARNMLGARERFTAVPFFWSQHYDIPINYVGHAERWDALDIDGDVAGKDCMLRFRRGGRVLAAASIFRDVESLRAEVELEAVAAA